MKSNTINKEYSIGRKPIKSQAMTEGTPVSVAGIEGAVFSFEGSDGEVAIVKDPMGTQKYVAMDKISAYNPIESVQFPPPASIVDKPGVVGNPYNGTNVTGINTPDGKAFSGMEEDLDNMAIESGFNPSELSKGVIEEMKEHTVSFDEAAKIAKDHLKENPSYYSDMESCAIESNLDMDTTDGITDDLNQAAEPEMVDDEEADSIEDAIQPTTETEIEKDTSKDTAQFGPLRELLESDPFEAFSQSFLESLATFLSDYMDEVGELDLNEFQEDLSTAGFEVSKPLTHRIYKTLKDLKGTSPQKMSEKTETITDKLKDLSNSAVRSNSIKIDRYDNSEAMAVLKGGNVSFTNPAEGTFEFKDASEKAKASKLFTTFDIGMISSAAVFSGPEDIKELADKVAAKTDMSESEAYSLVSEIASVIEDKNEDEYYSAITAYLKDKGFPMDQAVTIANEIEAHHKQVYSAATPSNFKVTNKKEGTQFGYLRRGNMYTCMKKLGPFEEDSQVFVYDKKELVDGSIELKLKSVVPTNYEVYQLIGNFNDESPLYVNRNVHSSVQKQYVMYYTTEDGDTGEERFEAEDLLDAESVAREYLPRGIDDYEVLELSSSLQKPNINPARPSKRLVRATSAADYTNPVTAMDEGVITDDQLEKEVSEYAMTVIPNMYENDRLAFDGLVQEVADVADWHPQQSLKYLMKDLPEHFDISREDTVMLWKHATGIFYTGLTSDVDPKWNELDEEPESEVIIDSPSTKKRYSLEGETDEFV